MMQYDTNTSDVLIADLVRRFFGVEPDAMATLAHGDAAVRSRYEVEDWTTAEPLDGVEVLLRRAVALCWRLGDHRGAVFLVSERQATSAGWPCAGLANRCVALAWALSRVTGWKRATPLLLEPDARLGEAMVPLIRFDGGLPTLSELLVPWYRRESSDADSLEEAVDLLPTGATQTHPRIASLREHFGDWFGIDADADAADLECDIFGLQMDGADARAVHMCIWIVTSAIQLGADLKEGAIRGLRLRTELDARLAGAPGAAAANLAMLLGLAMCYGREHLPTLLPATDRFAAELIEAGRLARDKRERKGDRVRLSDIESAELEDIAARGYVHVGQIAVIHVVSKLIYDDRPGR